MKQLHFILIQGTHFGNTHKAFAHTNMYVVVLYPFYFHMQCELSILYHSREHACLIVYVYALVVQELLKLCYLFMCNSIYTKVTTKNR